MINPDDIDFTDHPSEDFRWVLVHPYEGVLYFSSQEDRDDYAAESVLDLEGDRRLGLMCCAEIDTLFVEAVHVH